MNILRNVESQESVRHSEEDQRRAALSLRTNTATAFTLEFEHVNTAKVSRRFYRARPVEP